jgi:hypothetical protein
MGISVQRSLPECRKSEVQNCVQNGHGFCFVTQTSRSVQFKSWNALFQHGFTNTVRDA